MSQESACKVNDQVGCIGKVGKMSPFVSVIVITKNNARTIEKCIKSLLDQDYPKHSYEIIFVDGRSIDGTDELIKKYVSAQSIVRLYYEDYGTMGYARNVGIKASKGDILAFTDGDGLPTKEWLRKIVDTFESDDRLAIVGGLDVLTCGDKTVRVIDSWRRLKKLKNIKAIPYIKTVNFAIRRSAALSNNGFDSALSKWDEADLMARIYLRGERNSIVYDPEIVVNHERTLTGSMWTKAKKLFKRSVIGAPILLRKHLIRVALANPVSPLATSLYMVFACIIGVPVFVWAVLTSFTISFILTMLVLYLTLVVFYMVYASLATEHLDIKVPLLITFTSIVRIAGTFVGLIRWFYGWHKAKEKK